MADSTLGEILSQPEVWRDVQQIATEDRNKIQHYLDLSAHDDTLFVGCGTSYYLAQAAASVYALITSQRARATTASEVMLFPDALLPESEKGIMPVLISRSGTTTEVLYAANEIKHRRGQVFFGVSCRSDSDLIRESRFPLVVPSADEQSVVMTRSFTSMLLLIQYLAAIRSGDDGFKEALAQVPEHGERVLERTQEQAEKILGSRRFTKFVFLGHGPFYGLACEAMLKMKEMSLSISEAYHSLEFRHGPMSIVDEDMLLTILVSERSREEETRLVKEMKALGATTYVICERADAELRSASDHLLELDTELPDEARLILYMLPLQLLAYTHAVAKGLDPDHPKNLTQVVTLS